MIKFKVGTGAEVTYSNIRGNVENSESIRATVKAKFITLWPRSHSTEYFGWSNTFAHIQRKMLYATSLHCEEHEEKFAGLFFKALTLLSHVESVDNKLIF